jgi:hypothetical protein
MWWELNFNNLKPNKPLFGSRAAATVEVAHSDATS